MRYRALESVYAATVKYVGTTFALIAADSDTDLKDLAWSKIFESTSLGGWLDAVEAVCVNSKSLPAPVRDYCNDHSDYKQHPARNRLDRLTDHLNHVVEQLQRLGYRIDTPRSLSIRRALAYSVAIRNKCAHGALDSLFYKRIETHYAKALKLILQLLPFSKFRLWGTYGSNSLEFVEAPPKHRARSGTSHFWVASDPLSSGITNEIPFLLYKDESCTIYCLNDRVDLDNPIAEYIDYSSGNVVSGDVPIGAYQPRPRLAGPIRPRDYATHLRVLDRQFDWKAIRLTTAVVDACPGDSGVYMFTTTVNLGTRTSDVVLYVGKTTNLRERMKSYLRIKKGYDDTRPELSHMFQVYGRAIALSFCPIPEPDIASVERALYETTMPEYNIKSPPAN